MGCVDLHLHTTASDGVKSPSEIVRYAKSKGLQAISITDHDTIGGLEEGLAEGERIGFEVISGIEISAEHSPGSMHLLGYLIDIHHPSLNEKLKYLQRAREERNPRMVEKLNKLGVHITYEEVVKASGGGQVGRPHFAQVLIEKGYVRNFQEAFDRYLKKGASAYVDKLRFTPKEAIHLINEAGGVAVLGHPNTLGLNGAKVLENLIAKLLKEGLRGIEVYYPEHSPSEVIRYKALAERHGLILTGGTDYHGIEKESVDVGVGRGEMKLPYSMVEALKAARDLAIQSI
ncbi:MAG: PHP domain-containing protein [Deltaproteobacteria bacterium]|nr:PHP domain-containing protein [Deltaproteobacteria bacterium]MBM4323434.1 PHP domain-containing protein [Deltaproteobacteria bacterium]